MSKTVLTVDDSRTMRDMLKHSLVAAGFRVIQAEDGVHGLEVLAAIKNDSALRRTPVVVFSSSRARGEVMQAYNLNANSYIAKPVELADFIRVVKGVEEFWLTVVKLPKD